MNIYLKPHTTLIDARTESGYPLPAYDDCDGPVWLFGHEYGPTLVIRARSFETAWDIAIDESTPINIDEVPEAYGFGSQAELDAAVEAARDNGEYPKLIEGYEYQSNSTGTGIVNVGHYAWLREYDPRHDKVRLVIRSDECNLP